MASAIDRFRERIQNSRTALPRNQPDPVIGESLEERMGKQVSTNNQPTEIIYSGIIPAEFTTTRDDIVDRLEKKFSDMKYIIPPLEEKYRNIPELRITRMSTNEFADDSWKDRSAIVLKRTSDSATIENGRKIIKSLQEGTSQYLIGLIFVVAFQLKQPGMGSEIHVLPAEDELGTHKSLEVGALNKDVEVSTGTTAILEELGTESQLSQAYAYLATSLFKMFTRSSENFEKSWIHITTGFKKFYSYNLPLRLAKPNPDVLRMIHVNFSLSDLFKATLYRFLFNANKTGKITKVQSFLYDIDLAHTGMHVVSIAYRLCMSLNCTPGTLLRVINGNRFEPQLDSLATIFRLMESEEKKYERRLWKYGRLFNSAFMANLQTRSCPKFVYLLATSAAGILQIKQLEEVGPEDQRVLWLGSRIMLAAIKKLVDGDQPTLTTQFG